MFHDLSRGDGQHRRRMAHRSVNNQQHLGRRRRLINPRTGSDMRKSFSLGIGLVSLAMTAAACSSTGTGDAGGQGADAASGSSTLIGYSQRQIGGNAWYKTLITGAQTQAKADGVTVKVADAGGDAVQQNSDIQTFLASGAKAVIINPADPTGLTSSIAALGQAKVPFVVVNSNLNNDLQKKAFCYIAENQPVASELVGKAMAQKMDENGMAKGPLTGVVVGGFSGEVVTQIRYDGFMKGMKEYFASKSESPQIKMLPTRYGEWAPDKPLGQVRDIATANPDLNFVFVEADVMLPGTLAGLKSAGLDNVIVGGYNAQMSVIKSMMDNPDGPVQVEVSDGVLSQGEIAVQMAQAAIKGDTSACPGGTHFVDSKVITPQTAKAYYVADRAF
jgi:ribose transport system substrate-binding protein